MKKLWLTCIAACTGLLLFAQNPIWNYTPGQTKSEQLFNVANPSELRHRFIVELEKGNRMELQVHNREHFLKLMNIDSIIQLVNRSITMLNDSLASDELASRRIDIHTDPAGVIKIRTRVSPPKANHYMIQKNELAALKMEQDTIIVTGLMSGPAERISFQGIYRVFPYRITFLLNHYQQLNSYVTGSLTGIMEQIRSEWNVHYPQTDKANRRFNLYGYYSMTDPSRTRRVKNIWNANQYRTSVAPYVHVAVQGINGRFSPSLAAGVEFIASQGRSESHYQLFWEPYFNFDHSSEKNRLVRNDFITFQYTTATYENIDKRKIQFSQILSAGFLAGRKGSYFEKNTIKLGLPGFQYNSVFLHPEFIFNNFFKNFQPSLKLMLYLD